MDEWVKEKEATTDWAKCSRNGFPKWCSGKEPTCQCRRSRFNPWAGNIPLKKEMATHSSILAWEIPRAEEPGWLQSMGSQRVGHDWAHIHKCSQVRDLRVRVPMKIQTGFAAGKLRPCYHWCLWWNVPVNPLEMSCLTTKKSPFIMWTNWNDGSYKDIILLKRYRRHDGPVPNSLVDIARHVCGDRSRC